MCGIVGLWRTSSGDPMALQETVTRMSACLRHRGPDADGRWVRSSGEVGLGHQRLAIVDLTPAGAQPMRSANGRYVVAFNGEIYNHRQLREQLCAEGVTFRGSSDTEVMLEAFARWGIRRTLDTLVGMFAIALWDEQEQTLTLIRDRLGEKPLYLLATPQTVAFASEIKSLRTLPECSSAIDPLAIDDILRRGVTRGRRTIHQAVRKVLPGEVVTIRRAGSMLEVHTLRYWSPADAALRPVTWQSFDEAVEALDRLLRDSIRGQMLADVPVGAFLSGGIDSSLVVGVMQAVADRPVQTFTVGFDEQAFNEAPFARAIADHLGTAHTEIPLSVSACLDIVPRLPELFDEPFADASALPTFLVSQATRAHVTVALSGDAGDELFGGYSQYTTPDAIMRRLETLPKGLRPLAQVTARVLAHYAPAALLGADRRNAFARIAAVLNGADPRHGATAYDTLLSAFVDPAPRFAHPAGHPYALDIPWVEARTVAESQMLFDLGSYLPDDILVKVDRSAMAVSLETRAPLLDHRIVEFALGQPLAHKIIDGRGKALLRAVLGRYVPVALTDRPKQGFAVPLAAWLRTGLRPWADDLLRDEQLVARWLVPGRVRHLWAKHQRGYDESQRLWSVLCLLQWLRHQGA